MNRTDPPPAEFRLRQAIQAYPGKVGLAVRAFDGREYFFNARDSFQPASIIKLVVLCAAFKTLNLSERKTLPRIERGGGWGVLQHLTPPLSLTLRDIAFLMIFISDNVATDFLLSLLPKDATREILNLLELRDTRLEKGFGTSLEPAEYSTSQNATSAADLVALLEHIRRQPDLKALLAHQMDQAILHRALPGDVKRYTKSGQFSEARNDCGILEWDGGGCTLALLSAPARPILHGDLAYLASLDAQLAEIAHQAYRWARLGS